MTTNNKPENIQEGKTPAEIIAEMNASKKPKITIEDRINDALWEVCQFRSFQYCDIVRSAAERVGDFNDEEEIFQAADDELIYTHQVWTIMEELQEPQEADYHAAVEIFLDDVLSVCSYVAEKLREDESTEEDEKND